MIRRLLAILGRPLRGVALVECTEDRVFLHCADQTVSVRWSEIQRVFAYKRDLLTTDEIVVRLESTGTFPMIPVSEEWPGFMDFLAALERHLQINPQWYVEIMNPAFAPTPRVLFERETSGSNPTSA